jgi:transposase-like protein
VEDVREDGQKVLLAIKSMGSESTEAWRSVLDDLIKRGLRRPEFLIVDGAPGLDHAIASVWDGVPVQRCTVHKHRNLLRSRAHTSTAFAAFQLAAGSPIGYFDARLNEYLGNIRSEHYRSGDAPQ